MSTEKAGQHPEQPKGNSPVDELQHEPPSYARPLPDENAKHFALFTAWLSLDAGSREPVSSEGVRQALKSVWGGRAPADSTLRKLAIRHAWRDRARAYEADHAERVLKATGEDQVWQRVRAYRHRQQRISAAALEITISSLNLIAQRLRSVQPEDLGIRDIPHYLNAVKGLVETMSSAEAQAIGLTELMHSVEELQQRAARLASGGYAQQKGEA